MSTISFPRESHLIDEPAAGDRSQGAEGASGGGGAPPPAFTLSPRWLYREGCGHGVHQSHGVFALTWRSRDQGPATGWVTALEELLDEPIGAVPPQPDLQTLAAWVARALGALLRSAQIPTCRDVFLAPLASADLGVQLCLLGLPVASRQATLAGLHWLLGCLNDPPGNGQQMQARYLKLLDELKPLANPSSNHWRTLQAAYDERYPVLPMGAPGTVCIGTGVYRRLFNSFVTDGTSHLGLRLAQDKHYTARLLRGHGFPGAINRLVDTPAQARDAAQQLGYPVVVKPNDRDRGLGVSADIRSPEALLVAHEAARAHSARVLVEKFQPGFTHRFSVIEGRVMRVAQHVAFGVTGDGGATVEQLVQARASTLEEQKRARRTGAMSCVLDDEALGLLAQGGLSSRYVPAAGEHVRLRRRDNVSAGGTRITLSMDEVHPDNLRLAVAVSELIGLDFAGIDLITPDVARSWREGHATICEVNGNPQLVARDDPDMYKRVLRHVLPAPFRAEANLVLLLHVPTGAAHARLVRRFAGPGAGHGLSMASGIWLDGTFLSGPFAHGLSAALSLCAHVQARRLTFVMTVDEVERHGLPLGEIDTVLLPMPPVKDAPAALLRSHHHVMALLRAHVQKRVYLGDA